MDLLLIVFSAVWGCVGIVWMLAAFVMENKQTFYYGLIFFLGCVPICLIGWGISCRKKFHFFLNQIHEVESDIKQKKSQEKEKKEQLKTLFGEYIGFDTGIFKLLENSSYEHLVVLLQDYSAVRMDKKIWRLIFELTSLKREIILTESRFDIELRKYQKWSKQGLNKHFKPKNLDDKDYLNEK